MVERGGTLGAADLAAYETIEREPVAATIRDREVRTNPPPSSGGILIAFALELLNRRGGEPDTVDLVEVMEAAQAQRTREFLAGLVDQGFAASFLAADRLGSTTHITALDGDGMCASVTCSNGTGSGLIVPGTGVHVNNMLGEQDLNPLGFHRHEVGRRMPSMMSPTVVLRDGELEAGLGSGGSNRIRSAILQTIVRLVCEGREVDRGRQRPPGALRAGRGGGRAGDRPRRRSSGSRRTATRSSAGRIETCSSAASTRSPGIRRPASCEGRATRAAAARSPSPEPALEVADDHAAVDLGPLGDLARAADGVDEGAERRRQDPHPLRLRAQLEQALLGLGRELDPGRDPV